MNDKTRTGITLALVAAFISGVSVFYNKTVLVSGVDPMSLNILKNGTAGLILTLVLLASGKAPALARLNARRWGRLLLISLVGGSIPFILYFTGLREIPAINGQSINKTMFVWAALLALPFLKEKLHPLQLLAYGVIMYSALFTGGRVNLSGNSGELLVLAATMLWSAETVLAKSVMKHVDPALASWSRMFLGTLILLGIAAVTGSIPALFHLKSAQVFAVLGSGMLLSAYVMTFYRALAFAPVTLVTGILVLATPITNLLSAAFVTHSAPPQQIANATGSGIGILILLGVWYVRSGRRTPQTA